MKDMPQYHPLRHTTALFAALFLVLTASCVSRKNCLVCDEVTEGYRFVRFDSAYAESKKLRDRWILDSIRSAVTVPLGDTLIILENRGINYPPMFDIKSGPEYILVSYDYNDSIPAYIPVVRYYDRLPVYYPGDTLFKSTVFNWDIARLKRLLRCREEPMQSDCILIRVVTRNNRIIDWEEYRFDDVFPWKECGSVSDN